MNPYKGLPAERFWKTAVVAQDPLDMNLYSKKFDLPHKAFIFTAGSCFAQNVTRWLKARKLRFIDGEPAPPGMSDELREKYQYGVYSCRFGNIYTAGALRQLLREATGDVDLSPFAVWRRPDGRYVDAFRPTVDVDGHDTPQDVLFHRRRHLAAIRATLRRSSLFVFTLGLTETWRTSGDEKVIFPTAPGVIAGEYDPQIYEFKNFKAAEVKSDLEASIEIVRSFNPNCKFLLTVSPVPLAATAATRHVLTSTVYSKAVLRAVAGEVADERGDVDYFPSFELITNMLNRGSLYNADGRTVTKTGVSAAMRMFGDAHFPNAVESAPSPQPAIHIEDVARRPSATFEPPKTAVAPRERSFGRDICEEELLQAFHPAFQELLR